MGKEAVVATVRFPARNYPYWWPDPFGGPVFSHAVPAGKLIKFFIGRDSRPGEVIDPVSGAIGDPFIDLVIARGEFPTTLRESLAVLDRSNG